MIDTFLAPTYTRLMGRRAAILGLVVLLLVPIALSGHHHDGAAHGTRSCAACALVQHAPIAPAPAVAVLAAAVVRPLEVTAPVEAPARAHHGSRWGRAPPPSVVFAVV